MSETPVLWHIEISHYNEKARWALDHKRVPHVRKAPSPGPVHQHKAKRLTGTNTFPVLELDGRAIGDSTAIIAALEDRYPDAPLYPEDPDARRRALELEEIFDEQLAPEIRRIVFAALLEAGTGAMLEFAPPQGPLAPLMRSIAKVSFPLMKGGMARQYGTGPEQVAGAEQQITAIFDLIEAERAGGDYLVGDRFSVADLAAASLSHPIARPIEFEYPYSRLPAKANAARERLAEHPAIDWVRGVYARERPPSMEVAA